MPGVVKTVPLHWLSHCSIGIIMFWGHKKIPNHGLHFFFGSISYLTSSRDYIKRSKCWNEDYFEIMG